MSQQEDMETIQKFLQQLGILEASTDRWAMSVFRMATAGVIPCKDIREYNKAALATHDWVQQTFDKIRALVKGTSGQPYVDKYLPLRAKDPLLFGQFISPTGLAVINCQSDSERPDPKQLKMFGQLPGSPPCPEMAGSQGTQLGAAQVVVGVGAILAWTLLAVAVTVGGSVLVTYAAAAWNSKYLAQVAADTKVRADRAEATEKCWSVKNQYGKGTNAEYDRCQADAVAANPITEPGEGFFKSAGKFVLIVGGVAIVGIGTYYLAKGLYRGGEHKRMTEATA